MTKYFDWTRFREMSSRQKSAINTESTFSEQREKEDKERPPKDFGIKQMEDEVNIDWGKSIQPDSEYDRARRSMAKLAAADAKADTINEENDAEDAEKREGQ